MSDVILQPAPKTTAEYKAEIDRILREIDRLNDKMDRGFVEIQQSTARSKILKEETETIIARIDAKLDAIEASF